MAQPQDDRNTNFSCHLVASLTVMIGWLEDVNLLTATSAVPKGGIDPLYNCNGKELFILQLFFVEAPPK